MVQEEQETRSECIWYGLWTMEDRQVDGGLETTTLGEGVHFGCTSFVSHIPTYTTALNKWFNYFKVVAREASRGG